MARKNVFISYRRDDAAGFAQVIRDRLIDHVPRERVFMDVHDIDAGTDFVKRLEAKVDSCDVLIALIGRRWAGDPATGRSRLDDPDDFVRSEVGAALRRGVRVIPVLLDGATMPSIDSLPEELRGLARLNAVDVRSTRVDADTWDLVGTTVQALGGKWPPDEGGGMTYTIAASLWAMYAGAMATFFVFGFFLAPLFKVIFGASAEDEPWEWLNVVTVVVPAIVILRLPIHARLRTMGRAQALKTGAFAYFGLAVMTALLQGETPNADWIGALVLPAWFTWLAGASIERRSRLKLKPSST